MDAEMEEVITTIIASAGDARSLAMEAMATARDEGDIPGAQDLLAQAQVSILGAHKAQMDLIVKEARGERQDVSLLMVHAQDHVMCTMAVMDLAAEIVNLYGRTAHNEG